MKKWMKKRMKIGMKITPKIYYLFLTESQLRKIQNAQKTHQEIDLKISKTQMTNTHEKVKQANDLLKIDLEKSKKKKKETWKLGDLTVQIKIKIKIKEAINNKNSSVSLELNYGEIRGDGNLEIMLTKIQYELLERLPSELDPKTLNSNLEEPAVNLTFSSKQLKEMKLIPIIEPNYKLIDLLNNPKTRRALNLSLTPEIKIF